MTVIAGKSNVFDEINGDTIFLCCASFESRCLSVASNLGVKNIVSSYVFQYDEFKCQTENNAKKLIDMLRCGATVGLSNSDPVELTNAFVKVIEEINLNHSNCNILVDITTFTREGLLILIKLLKCRFEESKVKLIYNSASEMSDELSMGPRAFRSVMGYPGLLSPSKKNHLVILFGYEVDRARALIDGYEPDMISIGFGSKNNSIRKELHNRNVEFVEQLKSFYSDSFKMFEVSVRDPEDTYKNLQEYLSSVDSKSYNTIISPMNTKLSTVGIALFAIDYSEIQLCYSEMSAYNYDSFSSPSDEYYLYSL